MKQVSSETISKLINLIERYGIDFLDDNTKEDILSELKKGNKELAIEILSVLDKDWVKRAQEVEKILLFKDMQVYDNDGKVLRKPFYKANYMDYYLSDEHKVPTLRHVRPRYLGNDEIGINCFKDTER